MRNHFIRFILFFFLSTQVWAFFKIYIALLSSPEVDVTEIDWYISSTLFLSSSLKAFLYGLAPFGVMYFFVRNSMTSPITMLFIIMAGMFVSALDALYVSGVFPDGFSYYYIITYTWKAMFVGSLSSSLFIVLSLYTFTPATKEKGETDLRRRKILGSIASTFSGLVLVGNTVGPAKVLLDSFGYQDVDISKLGEGQLMRVLLGNQPIWILRRSQVMLKYLSGIDSADLKDPESDKSLQPVTTLNRYRSIRPEYFVVTGICTHLGCIPTYNPEGVDARKPLDGPQFFCPCHGGVFDLAGRVYKDTPPNTNLNIPDHEFISDSVIRIYSPGLSHRWKW